MPLLGILYFVAIGYLIKQCKVDEAALRTARQVFRGCVEEALTVADEARERRNPRELACYCGSVHPVVDGKVDHGRAIPR